MRALVLSIALIVAMPAFARTPSGKPDCARPQAFETSDRNQMRLKRLDQLPRAKQFLTVYREVDNCPAPIIVRDDIGAVPHR